MSADRSVALVARWTARAGEEKSVCGVLMRLASATRAEPGCLQYTIHRSTDDPRRFLIYERYVDEDAFQRHLESAPFRVALQEATPRLDGRERESFAVLA